MLVSQLCNSRPRRVTVLIDGDEWIQERALSLTQHLMGGNGPNGRRSIILYDVNNPLFSYVLRWLEIKGSKGRFPGVYAAYKQKTALITPFLREKLCKSA